MSIVDVVIPCYNYAHYLPGCVASALDQPGVDVRVLVIDDCSSDDSLAVARSLAERDDRVEVRHHPANRGHIATYNEGLLEWSSGDYVTLVSADDLVAPGAFGRAAAAMDDDPRIGMVYGPAPYFEHDDALPSFRRSSSHTKRWHGLGWIANRCRDGYNVISSPEVVVRRSVQHQVGGYRSEFPHAGDLEMWLRVAAVSDIAYLRGAPQAYYRVHAASMQRSIYSTALVDLAQRRDVFDAFFDEHPDLPGATELRDRARLALAREAFVRASRAIEHGEPDAAAEFETLAVGLSPAARRTPAALGLRWRQRLGPELCRRTRAYVPSAAVRRARSTYRHQRWKRYGE